MAIVVIDGGGLATWDITALVSGWDMPPWALHQLGVGLLVAAAVVGALGYWLTNLVDLGGDMERARRGDKPARLGSQSPSNVRQLPVARVARPRQGQDPLRQRAE